MQNKVIAGALALFLTGVAEIANAAGPYTLKIVARTGDTISGKVLTDLAHPALNNNGTVSFYATFPIGEGIFTPAALLVKAGDTIAGETVTGIAPLSHFGPISINDQGAIGFLASVPDGSGIFTQSALLARAGYPIGGITIQAFGNHPVLNNSGTGVFLASYLGGAGIFTQSALLAKIGDTIAGRTLTAFAPPSLLGPPSINDLGTVAFLGFYDGGHGIFTQSDLLVKQGDTISSHTVTAFASPSINNAGTIAFLGQTPSGLGIFTQSAALARTGDAIGGLTLTSFGLSPIINDAGTVVFEGSFAGGSGIFTQSALVARSGDSIDGKTISAPVSPVINDVGTIAFLAFFTDGSVGVVTAQLFAGTPGSANCQGTSVSALAGQYGSLTAAAAALGFPTPQALQDQIRAFCR